MKGFTNTTKMQPVHDTTVKGPVGGVVDFHPYGADHGLLRRQTPMTEELKEAGGTSPLRAGFNKGGSATHKHFHVHHHHHAEGGKVDTKSKHYSGAEKRAEREVEGAKPSMAKGGRKPFGHIKAGALHKDMGIKKGEKIPVGKIRAKLRHDKAAGNAKGVKRDVFAINAKTKFNKSAGGAVYAKGGSTTGGTRNRLAMGGAPLRGGRPMRPPVAPGPNRTPPPGMGFLPASPPPVTGGPVQPTLQRLGPGAPTAGMRPPLQGPMRRPMPMMPGPGRTMQADPGSAVRMPQLPGYAGPIGAGQAIAKGGRAHGSRVR